MAEKPAATFDFALLFSTYRADLLRFLQSRGFAEDAAADVTQEAFLRLLLRGQDDRIRNQKGYLFRIAANLGIDLRRRQAREGWANGFDDGFQDIADDSPSAERVLISRQELAILARAFEEVPPGPQAVFLARLEGLTFAEIGKRQGLPLKTAFSQAMKVTLLLKSRLDEARNIPPALQKNTPAERH